MCRALHGLSLRHNWMSLSGAILCDVLTHPDQLAAELARLHAGAWLPPALHARRENVSKARHSIQEQLNRLTDAYVPVLFHSISTRGGDVTLSRKTRHVQTRQRI